MFQQLRGGRGSVRVVAGTRGRRKRATERVEASEKQGKGSGCMSRVCINAHVGAVAAEWRVVALALPVG